MKIGMNHLIWAIVSIAITGFLSSTIKHCNDNTAKADIKKIEHNYRPDCCEAEKGDK